MNLWYAVYKLKNTKENKSLKGTRGALYDSCINDDGASVVTKHFPEVEKVGINRNDRLSA